MSTGSISEPGRTVAATASCASGNTPAADLEAACALVHSGDLVAAVEGAVGELR